MIRRMLYLLSFFALAAPAEPVVSNITEVTLFADRALVTREASLSLPEGVSQVELTPLPGWVNPASLRAKLSTGEVLDVQTRREFLAQTPDEKIREAEKAVREMSDRLAALQDRKQALQQKKQQVVKVGEFVTGTLPAETLTRDIPVEYFEKMSDFVYQSVLEADEALRELDREARELQPELNARQSRLNDLRQGNRLEQLLVTVGVRTEGAGEGTLNVSYELPGATWEAAHDVRVENDTEVKIVSLARVRQTSGEDWENVKLSFSTHRPGNAANIPQLETLLLGKRNAVNPAAFNAPAASGWSSSNEYYTANALSFNKARVKGGKAETIQWEGNQLALQRQQRQSEIVFSTLEERGTTALFEAEGRYTVRSDGNLVRVPYASVKQQGELLILAAPEISANAARGLELTYAHSQPLLPGEAALFVDGAYIGNTRLEFAGPGEDFVLFAGSEDRLKITRTLNHEESELKRGRRTNVMKVEYQIEVRNAGDQNLPLKLADRIPVSDNREIRVDHIRLEPKTEPDASGLVHWETTIPANSTRTFILRYVVDYPAGLQLKKREPAMNQSFMGDVMIDAGGAPDAAEQILGLERMF